MSDTPAAPKKKSPIVLILVIVLAVGGAGGGAFWYARKTAPVVEAAGHNSRATERGLLSLEPFVVNLADPSGSRFLRTTVQLIVRDEGEVERIKKTPVSLMQTRSAILELLTVQTADKLITAEGKTELKKAIAERASAALDDTKVIDVLFSDFVVQF